MKYILNPELLQVEMERRFAAVLAHVVRRLMDSVAPAVRLLLDAAPTQGPAKVSYCSCQGLAGKCLFLDPIRVPLDFRRVCSMSAKITY